MKSIGIIGGMGWPSTLTYYRLINEHIQRELGGYASAKVTIRSVNLAEIEPLESAGHWDEVAAILIDNARALERAGVDVIAIASNAPHIVADQVEAAVTPPLLHIADPAGQRLRADGVRRVGLVGTRFVTDHPSYADRLRDRHGLEVVLPDEAGRAAVHSLIFDELCQGQVGPAQRDRLAAEFARLAERGADAVLLACTDFSELFDCRPGGVGRARVNGRDLLLYDTTPLHTEALANFALAGESPGGQV